MTFAETALKLLHDYKKLLKKQLSSKEVKIKLASMGLKRTVLKRDTEASLYKKAMNVMADWHSWAGRNKDSAPLTYSGMEEFIDHFMRIISYYQLENNKVIHIQQKTSASLVKAIQLIGLPPYKLNEGMYKELQDSIRIVNKFGSKEQQKLLLQSLRSYNEQHKASTAIPTIEKLTVEYANKMAWKEEEEVCF